MASAHHDLFHLTQRCAADFHDATGAQEGDPWSELKAAADALRLLDEGVLFTTITMITSITITTITIMTTIII